MPISPINPPNSPSTARLVQLMEPRNPATDENWIAGWDYPPHRYGGLLSVGARLKHNTNIQNYCNIEPFQSRLATHYIKWLTVAFKFPRQVGHNVAIEMVPLPTWGRLRSAYGGPAWVQLTSPNGSCATGFILSGSTVAGPTPEMQRNNGTVLLLPHNYLAHPWAVFADQNALSEVDAPITNIVSSDPNNVTADSKLDAIVCDWWVRVVPFNEALPLNHDLSINPVLAVAAADPYVYGDGVRRIGLNFPGGDAACTSPVGASAIFRVTEQWQQFGYFTCTEDYIDKHTTQAFTGITNAALLALPPPGYDNTAAPPPGPDTDPTTPIFPRPSVGNWFPKLTTALNTWTTASAASAAPTSLLIDEDGDEMLLQQSASTAAKRTIIFRAVDATDGFTAETGLSWGAGDLKISKNGATEANHSGAVAEIAGGLYKYEFALSELDTLGVVSFRTNKAGVRPAAFLHQVVAFDPQNANSLGIAFVDAAVSSRLASTVYENTDAFLDKTAGVETGVTVRGALRLMLAVLAGKVSGAGTGTEVFRNGVADSKARVTSVVDSSGNRTVVTTDQT